MRLRAHGAATGAAFGWVLAGCISSAPIVPVTPTNQAQVTSCQTTATLHNDLVVGGFVLGGASAALAGASGAIVDQATQRDVAASAAVLGALAVADAAIVAWASHNFADGNCSSVVGPLSDAARAHP
jgi:hypothetical protein